MLVLVEEVLVAVEIRLCSRRRSPAPPTSCGLEWKMSPSFNGARRRGVVVRVAARDERLRLRRAHLVDHGVPVAADEADRLARAGVARPGRGRPTARVAGEPADRVCVRDEELQLRPPVTRDVETRNGSVISGTGSVAAADAPLIGSVPGSVLEAATVARERPEDAPPGVVVDRDRVRACRCSCRCRSRPLVSAAPARRSATPLGVARRRAARPPG